MAGKKTKRSEVARKPQPTVQHESSANSAQNSGIHENAQSNQAVNSSNKKRRHSGSHGSDRERGTNH